MLFQIDGKTSKLEINKCTVHEACEFNALWHSRLPKIHWSNVVRNKYYICYRAEAEQKVYAVAIWSSPVARFGDYEKILELRRLAISSDAPHNTASYMISKMVKDIKIRFPNIVELVSYQDTDVHEGTIYKASNWTIGNYSKRNGKKWTNRFRNIEQTTSDKVRWEYKIKIMEAGE